MTEPAKTYESDALTVEFRPRRCIHAAECVHGLPAVFDPDRKPWVDPKRADAGELIAVIERCPTGALRYRPRSGGPGEEPDTTNTVDVAPDGPLYLRGRLVLLDGSGGAEEETRMALCRCGASANKPYCDNAHRAAGFASDPDALQAKLKTGKADPGAPLEITPAPNGPLLVGGPLTVRCANGASSMGVGGALCRCGASANKPYCDGAHVAAGFRSS